MSDELKHDPEFPYAIVFNGHVIAKFPAEGFGKVNAIEYAADVYDSELVDTTPKPKIPEDAEYILINTTDYSYFAQKIENEWLWHRTEEVLDYDGLVEYIGDGEVTVLVRKEES